MHLRLNRETGQRIAAMYGIRTYEDAAEFLELDAALVRAVWEGDTYPTEEYIAACLAKFPISFDLLFDVELTDSFDVRALQESPDLTPRTDR